MTMSIALIGFGEAGSTFAAAMACGCSAYDRKTDDPVARTAMQASMAAAGAVACTTPGDALAGADVVLSLVTAGEALAAARAAAPLLAPGALWIDMNSVAPDSKRRAAAAIEAAGGRYVDAAIMAPVQPSALSVPVLLSGLHAGGAASALAEAGFLKLGIVGAEVGRAATIKMLRSVMIKGIEALTAEMMLAARLAGVDGDVLASLGEDWARRADYNLERMRAHGARRAAEMEEVASTLEALGVEPLMTRATVARQREMAE